MGLYSCLYQFPICMLCKPYFPVRNLLMFLRNDGILFL
jgi:hypothetical protein